MAREKTQRNEQIIHAYARGRTQQSIAEEHGIARETVRDIIAAHRSKQGPIDKAEHIAAAVDLLDELIQEAMAVVESTPAPITAGKDGLPVVDPERKGPHGEPVYVRDHSGRLAAMSVVRSLQERKAKLLGLDSATKVEQSGQVTYVLPGVAPETLQ
jgi:hypothetical protein